MEAILEYLKTQGAAFGLQVLAAIAVFVVGRYVAKLLRSLVERLMTRANVDVTLVAFTANLTYAALLVFIIIAALGQLGGEQMRIPAGRFGQPIRRQQNLRLMSALKIPLTVAARTSTVPPAPDASLSPLLKSPPQSSST